MNKFVIFPFKSVESINCESCSINCWLLEIKESLSILLFKISSVFILCLTHVKVLVRNVIHSRIIGHMFNYSQRNLCSLSCVNFLDVLNVLDTNT